MTLEWNDELKMKYALEILFDGREQLLKSVFCDKKPMAFDTMEKTLYQSSALSSGEFEIVRIAMHLWFHEGNIDLNKVIQIFDPQTYYNFIKAISYLRNFDLG